MSAKFGPQPVQGSRVRPDTRTDAPTAYTRGTREATGIIRYLIWVSRRYISLGVDGTACSLDFRFCTRVDPWFTVISIKDPLERVPIIPPSPLPSSPRCSPRCNLFFFFFFASTFACQRCRAPTFTFPDDDYQHPSPRGEETEETREREREWETLYRRPVENFQFSWKPRKA